MANISAIKLPSGNTYNIKDNSGEKSSHLHDSTSLVPLISKTFTDVIGTANDWANATFFFGSVKPTGWYDIWKIKFKILIYSPGKNTYIQESEVMMSGDQGVLRSYSSMNTVVNHLVYYGVLYRLKSAGFTNGYGHSIGCRFYSSNYPIDTNYKRTIVVDILETENCTFEFYDNCLKYAQIPGTGSTNYDTYSEINWVSNGLQEVGDADTLDDRQIYFGGKTSTSKGVWAGSLFMEDGDGTYQNICAASDGTITSSNRTTATTKIANTSGFRIGGKVYYSNTNYGPNTNISGYGVVYNTISLFDSRYAFNTTLTAGSLTTYKPIYLVGTISNGLFYLDSTWWTQTPTTTGKVYVLVGGVYDSTTSNCRIDLYQHNPWYYYDGTRLQPYVATASSVAWSGITSKPTTISGYGITDAKIASGVITLGSNTITPLTSSSTLSAAKLSGAIPSAVTATTQTAGDNSTKIATTAFVSSAISGLPTPMQFIGTVGTNGTTTWANLPAASGHNGYTYKVITAHTAETGKPAADVGDALISNGTEWIVIPAGDETATQSATTGISIAAHGTGTVIGVQSTTTTASKVTVGSSSTDYGVKSAGSASTWTFEEKTIPNVTSAGSASSWTFEEKTIPNVTAAGSGSASLTFAMDTTDTKKLKITFSHTHTAPTIGTAIKVQSKSGGSNGTAPTLGTAIKVQSKSGGANSTAPTLGSKVPTVSASDVTVPIKNANASTFVTGTTHTVTDNGHTHTI